MLNKKIMFISIFICFLAISCVSATDTDNLDLQLNATSTFENVTADDVVVYDVHSSDEFLKIADQINQYDNPDFKKNVVINLDSDKEYKFNSDIKDTHLKKKNRVFDDYPFVIRASGINLVINGNGSTIKNDDEYSLGFLYVHWC